MTRIQVEHIKTGLLVFLVLLSFIFSGYLWYSTPASETIRPDNDLPPYIFKNPAYSNRERHELIAPSQLVLHKNGAASILFADESTSFKSVEHMMHQLNVPQVREIHPTNKDWQVLSQATGIELLFLQDVSYELVEAFFEKSIPYQQSRQKVAPISRIWVFRSGPKVKAWFISDKSQQIGEASLNLAGEQLEKYITIGNTTASQRVAPAALQGPLPWESNTALFSRIFYFPATPLRMKQLSFSVENINIDNMKQWLFRDPEIKPLIPNSDESFYMNNDQLLNHNTKFNYMTYSDSSSLQDDAVYSLPHQLDQVKTFMQRHQGWTGFYLLDEIQKENLYTFRLFKQGYPVFWLPTDTVHNIHPDLIQLQAGNNEVSKYIRSMLYLAGKPIEGKTLSLPRKDSLMNTLSHRGIPLSFIARIFPGYVATEKTLGKKKQINLDPAWIITQTDGKREFVKK